MHDHEYFEELIFNEDSLTDSERTALTEHLASCEACRAFRQDWMAVDTMLKTSEPVRPAPGFTQRWVATYGKAIRQDRAAVRDVNVHVAQLAILATVLSGFLIAVLFLITDHRLLDFLVATGETIDFLRLTHEFIAGIVSTIRIPLLIFGVSSTVAAITVFFGFLFSVKKHAQKKEIGVRL